MARRLISDAIQFYETEIAPNVVPGVAAPYRAEIDRITADVRAHASAQATLLHDEARQVYMAAAKELSTVRDSLETLAGSGSNGRMPAGEYATQLRDLHTRQEQAEEQLAEVLRQSEIIEAIEEDPIAWFDSQGERFPNLVPTWSF